MNVIKLLYSFSITKPNLLGIRGNFMEATGVNWKQVYHWLNVVIIPIWAITAIVANSNTSGPAPVLFAAGSAWIIISGIINKRVRDFVVSFIVKLFSRMTLATVVVSCLFAGFALLAILIVIGLLATFAAIAGLLVLAVYLFATSAQALYFKIY